METVPVGGSGGGRAQGGDPFGLVGTTVDGKYRVERPLGEGGFGVVYAGTHLLLQTPVAIKVMKPLAGKLDQTERAVRAFVREARTLFQLTHPGIVRMYDVGTLSTPFAVLPYVVLELLEGRTLEEEILQRAAEGRPFGNAEIRSLFDAALAALAFAHESGVAHLDLKPSNIMLTSGAAKGGEAGKVKILDFGLAKLVTGETHASTSMSAFTPAYAAPEQWSEGMGAPGPRTDVFAMGLTLAETCTLSPAIAARTPAQIFSEVMKASRKVDLTQTARVGLPPGLQDVVDRALATDPALRYADAAAMRHDLGAVFEGRRPTTTVALPPSGGPRVDPRTFDHAAETVPASAAKLAVPPTLAPPPRSLAPIAIGVAAVIVAGGATAAVLAHLATRTTPTTRAFELRTLERTAARARLDVDALSPGARYDPAALLEVARPHEATIKSCYTRRLAEVPRFDAVVRIFVAVRPSGDAFERVDASDLGRSAADDDKLLHACVSEAVRGFRFPAHDKDDVEGAFYTFHFSTSRHPPPPVEATRARFLQSFDNHGKKQAPSPATVVERGDLLAIDYEDGVALCVDRKSDLLCRWIQLDSMGLAALQRDKAGKTLKGTWGFWPSDRGEGEWQLTRD